MCSLCLRTGVHYVSGLYTACSAGLIVGLQSSSYSDWPRSVFDFNFSIGSAEFRCSSSEKMLVISHIRGVRTQMDNEK